MPPQLPSHLNRRQALQLLGMSGMGYLLSSCSNEFTAQVGELSDPLNRSFGELLVKPQQLIPEFPKSAIDPKALIVNTYDTTPEIDPDRYRLTIDGEVKFPIELDLTALKQIPPTSIIMQHVCVEGWAAIVQWGGFRLRDLATMVQPKDSARYVLFQSADKYTESWDLASALHPQTLLADRMNGQPLPAENGAPLRLATPIKLGYKLSKWVTKITFANQIPKGGKGSWEEQGYEWFGGI
ncbi:molybdopterin-dependent oxidoreductase [Chamaesiphon sp.]|uniref:molybdopterin-dependent oxidoreductase n=1 Tax=Chamaesiphon sp. TaxID=2814140 RepID=UPI0035944B3D